MSNTCYGEHKNKVAGYGRQIRNITLSNDCPQYFLRTDHISRPKDFTPIPKQVASRKAGIEASYVLPGGAAIFGEQPEEGRSYSKIKMNNQVSTPV